MLAHPIPRVLFVRSARLPGSKVRADVAFTLGPSTSVDGSRVFVACLALNAWPIDFGRRPARIHLNVWLKGVG